MRRLRLMVRFAERTHLYEPHRVEPAGEHGTQVDAYPSNGSKGHVLKCNNGLIRKTWAN